MLRVPTKCCPLWSLVFHFFSSTKWIFLYFLLDIWSGTLNIIFRTFVKKNVRLSDRSDKFRQHWYKGTCEDIISNVESCSVHNSRTLVYNYWQYCPYFPVLQQLYFFSCSSDHFIKLQNLRKLHSSDYIYQCAGNEEWEGQCEGHHGQSRLW